MTKANAWLTSLLAVMTICVLVQMLWMARMSVQLDQLYQMITGQACYSETRFDSTGR